MSHKQIYACLQSQNNATTTTTGIFFFFLVSEVDVYVSYLGYRYLALSHMWKQMFNNFFFEANDMSFYLEIEICPDCSNYDESDQLKVAVYLTHVNIVLM